MALTTDQETFSQLVAGQTGLNIDVVRAWVNAEVGGTDGNGWGSFNFLNMSDHKSGFGSVQLAATAAAQQINTSNYYGGIRQAAGTGDASAELSAIASSPWDAGHYSGSGGPGSNLQNSYNSVKPSGAASVGTLQVQAASGGNVPFGPGLDSSGRPITDAQGNPTTVAPGSNSTALATPAGASAEQIAIARYGAYAQYLNDPEWGPIIKQAATEGRDEAWLEGQLSQTEKWKTTSDAARQFDFTNTTDPATAQAQVQTQLFSIRAYARANGIVLDDTTLNQLATASARLGWSADEMHAMVSAHFTYVSGQAEGAAGADVASFKKIAADYGVPISDATLGGFVTAVVEGNATTDDFTTWIRDTAKTKYPSIAKQLDQGLTTAQIFSPTGQQIGKTLGINPDTIDVSDPKWSRFLAPPPNPQTGQPDPNAQGVMNAWQVDQTIKSDGQYGYRYSQDAHDQAATLLDTLGKTFGKVG
jgi:hypothetical protein